MGYMFLEEHGLITEPMKEKPEEKRQTAVKQIPIISDLLRLQRQQANKPTRHLFFR
ncbi:MAG: hypothetical protein IKG39_09535 [Lachnospiraceae bacterium]|jgi:hypothetical protein|nr:hypothetical protein [Lachnospiraceae bacterium]